MYRETYGNINVPDLQRSAFTLSFDEKSVSFECVEVQVFKEEGEEKVYHFEKCFGFNDGTFMKSKCIHISPSSSFIETTCMSKLTYSSLCSDPSSS